MTISDQMGIQRAVVTLAGTDDSAFPIQQVSYQGKAANVEVVFPYGIHANLLTTKTYCMLFAINNEEENRTVMGHTPSLRPRGLAEGEVVFYHPVTGSQIYFRNNGDIDITINDGSDDASGGNANITITKDLNITVSGDTAITIDGDASVSVGGNADIDVAGNTTLDTAQFDINSALTNIGSGGDKIARIGDSVEVTISSGSSAGTYPGTITSGGTNTSI